MASPPSYWDDLREVGFRTLFRFPLRPELTEEQRSLLADRLLTLPITAILFLKHLERVEVVVDSESDDYGILGIDDSVPAGPLRSKARVRIEAGTRTDLAALVARADLHCPVTDALRRAVPWATELSDSAR